MALVFRGLVEGKRDEVIEDAACNCAGAGQIAGIGVGPDGEPGVKRRKKGGTVVDKRS